MAAAFAAFLIGHGLLHLIGVARGPARDAGELTDFRSADRYQASPDGKTFSQLSWSTPLRDYRQFGQVRLASKGEARWHEPEGDYAYIELLTEDVRYNIRSAD